MKILITKDGGIQMLHDDIAGIEDFGQVEVSRASHVEYDNDKQQWYVQSAASLKILKWCQTRKEALDWERDFYSPGGEGWSELTDRGIQ